MLHEVFEPSRSKSLPLEKTRSKLANPVELSWGLAAVLTGVASFDGDLLIGIFGTGFTLTELVSISFSGRDPISDLPGASCLASPRRSNGSARGHPHRWLRTLLIVNMNMHICLLSRLRYYHDYHYCSYHK